MHSREYSMASQVANCTVQAALLVSVETETPAVSAMAPHKSVVVSLRVQSLHYCLVESRLTREAASQSSWSVASLLISNSSHYSSSLVQLVFTVVCCYGREPQNKNQLQHVHSGSTATYCTQPSGMVQYIAQIPRVVTSVYRQVVLISAHFDLHSRYTQRFNHSLLTLKPHLSYPHSEFC